TQLVDGISGSARVQVVARDEQGLDARLTEAVRGLPGVAHAAPLLEQRAQLSGPGGNASVLLVGVDPSLASLGGTLTHGIGPTAGLAFREGLVLPSATAAHLGARRLPLGALVANAPGRTVVVRLRGRAFSTRVAAVVGPELIGPLSQSAVAVARLAQVQAMAQLPGRVDRILVVPAPHREALVHRELRALVAGRADVVPIDQETRVLAQATGPNNQSTGLFAAISAVVGLLLAFNAMLLTVPERRRSVADLRLQGFTPRQVVLVLGFQSLLLGALASAVGVALGGVLARTLFGTVPTYLSFAFPTGSQRVVEPRVVALAFAGGVAATCLAAAQPLADLRGGRPLDAVYRSSGEPGQALGARTRAIALCVGLLLFAVTTLLLVLRPGLTVAGIAALALATVLTTPALLALVVRGCGWLSCRLQLNMLTVATMALRSTTLRSIALAASGAVAVFGSVAIEGAHRDLVRGLDRNFGEFLSTADLWVTTGGDDLTTEGFHAPGALALLRGQPGVAGVQPYYGGLLDVGDRRTWVIGRPPGDQPQIPPSQVVAGNAARASAQLRAGGAVAVSEGIARQLGAHVGGPIALPTPTGVHRFRLAATLTNLGWGPGAIVVGARSYRAAWGAPDPTALEVHLRPGANPARARAQLQRALTPGWALTVQTTAQRLDQYERLARQGLDRLSVISKLLLAAAALALAAATGASTWQRRRALAAHRLHGFAPGQLRRALLLEASIVLGTGCFVGALAGVYGHLLLGRWLRLTTGFPAPFSIAGWQTLETFALVATVSVALVLVPSYLATRVPARVALQD
ncbi:MAG TPA: ABC transporter permease, partial [Conexibacter sp.]|nr:ABC transporter permease [Conexibacter sp.]